MQLIYEQGILVFIIYFILFIDLVFRIYNSGNKYRLNLIVLFGAVIVLSFFQYPFYIQENLIPIMFLFGIYNSLFCPSFEIRIAILNSFWKYTSFFYWALIFIIISISIFNIILNILDDKNSNTTTVDILEPYYNRNQRFLNQELKYYYLNNDFKNSLMIVNKLEKFQKSDYLFYLKAQINLKNRDTINAIINLKTSIYIVPKREFIKKKYLALVSN